MVPPRKQLIAITIVSILILILLYAAREWEHSEAYRQDKIAVGVEAQEEREGKQP